MYRDNTSTLLRENPLRISFANERALDTGGVSRDMFSAFFEEMYERFCDGSALLTLVVHPHIDFSVLPTLGTIISHGYIACGVLPIRIAFPTLAQCLLGLASIPDDTLLQAFRDGISTHDASIINNEAFESIQKGNKSFSSELQKELLSILSAFGCRELPTPGNLRRILIEVAHYEFIMKPKAATVVVYSGIPKPPHSAFWVDMGVGNLSTIYEALSVSPKRVLGLLENVNGQNLSEERVITYLRQFVGNMAADEIRNFFRFVTGSSVSTSKPINVTFNNLDGLARRPISHTCSHELQLSVSYRTYPEFASEFRKVIADQNAWIMDAL